MKFIEYSPSYLPGRQLTRKAGKYTMKLRTKNLRWSDIDMSQIELSNLVVHFAHTNRAEGKSPKTVSWYSEMLGSYTKYLEATEIQPTLADLNITNVRSFIIHEQGRQLSPFTVACKVRALKAFASWLLREGYTTCNILANLKPYKTPQKMIEPLTPDEINKLMSVQNPLTAIGSRNIAILTTFLDTGMRANELSGLYFEDAHIEEGFLKVMGKGSKERIIPIGSLEQKVLWRYVMHFRSQPDSDLNNFLFLTLDGKRLQTNVIRPLLKRWGKRAGVPRLHAHLCRHTFATNFLLYKCGDTFRLQQMLGHSTLEMVRRYVHYASIQDMIQNHVSSPMDRMGIKGLKGYKIDRLLNKRN